jgi:hypothetical protein
MDITPDPPIRSNWTLLADWITPEQAEAGRPTFGNGMDTLLAVQDQIADALPGLKVRVEGARNDPNHPDRAALPILEQQIAVARRVHVARGRAQIARVPAGCAPIRDRSKSTTARPRERRDGSRRHSTRGGTSDDDSSSSEPPGDLAGRRFCVGCGDDISQKRAGATTCGPKCRVRKHRHADPLSTNTDADPYLRDPVSPWDPRTRGYCRHCGQMRLETIPVCCLGRWLAERTPPDPRHWAAAREMALARLRTQLGDMWPHSRPQASREAGLTELPALYDFAEHRRRHVALTGPQRREAFTALPPQEQAAAWLALRAERDQVQSGWLEAA